MDKKKSDRKQFWIILMIAFLGFLGMSMPYLIFPALFLNPAYLILPLSWGSSTHALFLGATLAAYPLGQFIGSPILGSLSDQYGRRQLLWSSLLITAVCNLLTGFAIDGRLIFLLIISRFMAGFMEGNVAIVRAMAADITTIAKHESFGKMNAAISIAYLLGPLLGGLMADKNLWKSLTASTPFYIICGLFLILSGISASMLQKTKPPALLKIQTFWERVNFVKKMAALFSNKPLQLIMLISTAFSLAIDIFYEFGPVYLTVKWMQSPAQLTLYNGVLCLALAIGNGWLPTFFSKRISSRLTIICSMAGFVFLLIGIILATSTILMLIFFMFSGLLIGLGVTLLTVKISDTASPSIQGEVLGTQLSLRVLGDAFICLIGSALLLLSPKIILGLAAVLCFIAMICYIIKIKE